MAGRSPIQHIKDEAQRLAHTDLTARQIYLELKARYPKDRIRWDTVKCWVRDEVGPRIHRPSDEEIAKVVELVDSGLGVVEVGRMIGRSHSAVSRWYRLAKDEDLDMRGCPKSTDRQAREVRDDVLSEVPWWARRCTNLDWKDLRERLAQIKQPPLWWYRRRHWTIGKWAEYALGHHA